MNPVLLKPQDSIGSQIIVHGKRWGQAKGRDYQKLKPQLMSAVIESFERLKASHDLVIVEGQGLRQRLISARVILPIWALPQRPMCLLSLWATLIGAGSSRRLWAHTILPKGDLEMIAGYLINKFRGDVSLFDDGLTAIEGFTGWKSFGVVPWLLDAAKLPAEDSVALERLSKAHAGNSGVRVVVPMLDRISNFDDLDPLINHEAFSVQFVRSGDALPDCDVVIIPGSKSTIGDLEAFATMVGTGIYALCVKGVEIVGICSGYQMLGREVHDPDGIEGDITEAKGLGLLDVVTTMQPEKQVRTTKAWSPIHDCALEGYEIHLGKTEGLAHLLLVNAMMVR